MISGMTKKKRITRDKGVDILLTNEELVEKIKQGIDASRNLELLYKQNEQYIRKIANRYRGYAEIEDLMQEGYFGLYEAVQRYENEHEVLFMSYAGFWIAQAIKRYIENSGRSLRLPVHLHELIYKYKRIVNAYMSQLGRNPTDKELCRHLRISPNRLKNLERYIYEYGQIESLDEPVNSSEDGDLLVCDTVPDSTNIENEVVNKIIEQDLKTGLWQIVEKNTTEEENQVILYRFKNNLTLKATGDNIGKTIERARQLENSALKKLRRSRIIRELEERYAISYSQAYKGSLSSFRYSWMSSTEKAAFTKMGVD